MSDPPALEGVASIPVADIIPVGSHIGCGKLATRLGKERLAAMLRGFGFGQATGIEIRPDLSGIVRKASNWDSTTTLDLASTGHSVLASPIQLGRAYAALANGGLLPGRMRLVDRVVSAKGETTAAPAAAPVRVLSEAAARFAAKGLREACLRGIARSAALPNGGVPVAGFPGLGHHFDHTRNGYGQDMASAISLFAGFAPADDHPRYVLVVIIDRPRKNDSAAELFRDIMAQLLPAAAGGR